jgi:phosphoribosyl-ATP pyrophosphohydrolase/phosphoribosyl-AMP cyclohydrolase
MSAPAPEPNDALAETGMRAEGACLPASAETGTDSGDTRCARIPESASAEGAYLPALVVYDERGLLPCVVQDWRSGEVLMLAYMNEDALRRTQATGELHLWSRSRGEPWHKGATSGNTQVVRTLRVDCDGDTLLALVEPAGPACHTGERTCFHRGVEAEAGPQSLAPHEMLPALERTLEERARERPAGSYTVALLDNPPLIGEKVMEEAEEVARAAREESPERVDEEAADVLYHLLVLLHSRGRSLADAERVLDARRR